MTRPLHKRRRRWAVLAPFLFLASSGVPLPSFAQPAAENEAADANAAPGPSTELDTGLEDSKRIDLTLEQAVRSALARNPNVKRSEIDTSIASLAIGRRESVFSPVLTLTGNGRYDRQYNEFAGRDNSPFSPITNAALSAQLTGLMKFGGRYTLTSEAGWLSQPNEFFATLSPRYTSRLSARWVQPLLRGYGTAINQAPIERERLTVELRKSEEREQLLQSALRVVSSYWTLVLRHEELRILQTRIEAAKTLQQVVIRRVGAGEDPKSALVQAEAAVAERLQAVEGARIAIADGERALLGDSYLHETGVLNLADIPVPVDTPATASPSLSLRDEVETALENRPEVARMKREIKLANIDLEIAENAKKLRLEAYAEAGLLGLSGRSKVPAGSPPIDQPPSELIGGYGTTLSNMPRAPFFEVGLRMQLPFDNADAENAAEQAKLRIKRAQTQDIETRVKLDVRNAVQRVNIAKSSVDSAAESLRLAEANLKAQERLYEAGGATLFDVTRSQDDVSRAQAQVALSRGQLSIALAVLDAARGTLLGKFGVDVSVAE